MSSIPVDSISGLSAFVRAAEAGSYVAAGRVLGVSASAIGKSVARLEEKLGVRLLNRTTRSVRLTSEGEIFFERSRRVLADLADAEAELSRSRAPRGRLRVSLPAIGYRMISQLLSKLARSYPDIALELDFSDRFVDVVEEGFDIVVRSGPLVDSRLVARRLWTFRFLVVAAPAYLARRSAPRTPKALARHACIQFRFATTGKVQPWRLSEGHSQPLLGPGIVCNSVEAQLVAARQGLGLAYVPDFAVREELASNTLVPVLERFTTESGTFHALWPASRTVSPKVRVFVDGLAAIPREA